MTAAQLRCPVCSSFTIELFFEMDDVPVLCNVLHPTHESAVSALRGTIRLGFCSTCGHIYNYAFDAALTRYTQAYENSLHFSSRFQTYAGQLAHDLIARHALRGKRIIEIGCGKGDFLKLLCDAGDNRGVGFDASFQPELMEKNERFTVIRDLYSERYSHIRADFLICRHVLEHIEHPREFLETTLHAGSSTRRVVDQEPIANSYFEVPNALWTLRDLGVWDVMYEHCSYFTPQSLTRLFSSGGFNVLRIEEKYDGQFLGIEVQSPQAQSAPHAASGVEEIGPLVGRFAERYRHRIHEWRKRFDGWKRKRVVVWGSGSKGVTFLNVMKQEAVPTSPGHVEYVVDINPRKQGMHVAGTGQKIVAPAFLTDYRPDVVIVMNPIYEAEIRKMLGSNAEFVVA